MQLVTDRAAPTLIKMLEGRQGTGVVREATTIAVGAVAKMFVGDVIEEGERCPPAEGVLPHVTLFPRESDWSEVDNAETFQPLPGKG